METTLILLKPDSVQRSLAGEIIGRIERKGLKIVGLKMMQLTEEIVDEHYDFHIGKPFYPDLKAFMMSSPVIAIAVNGNDAVKTIRNLTGATNPQEALPGSIRGDLALSIDANIIHASDSLETAQKELKRFFKDEEIYNYEKISDKTVG